MPRHSPRKRMYLDISDLAKEREAAMERILKSAVPMRDAQRRGMVSVTAPQYVTKYRDVTFCEEVRADIARRSPEREPCIVRINPRQIEVWAFLPAPAQNTLHHD